MNYKKIIIFENDILFSILDEIKNELNFDLIKVDNIESLQKDKNSSFLLISSKKVSNIAQNLVLDSLPIKIKKLVQMINIKLIKNKFSSQSDLVIGKYKLNLNSRDISKNSIILPLTEREANLIIFLNSSSKPVNVDQLQKKVWDYGDELETHTVETHIYRLRKKIKQKFSDDNFIISTKDGYLIN
tara:strand:+ start:17 stop:574 length:558 start_codon:yes stop_codon:yes gene_type:complete